ncbi:MAG: hypothetical protein HC937_03530, partial [Aquincola sp.]|nr:hypothetical protein [Aquincola sp.]
MGGGRVIARSFGAGGARSVTLTVVDGANRVGTITRTVTVSPPATPASTVTAQGAVKTIDGSAISGVLITQVGGVKQRDNRYPWHSQPEPRHRHAIDASIHEVRLCRSGAAAAPARHKRTDAYFDVVMRPRDAALTLADAAVGGSLTGRDGAAVTLPANALVNAAGTAVSGAVQIAMTPVDVTARGAGGFPGGFDGVQQNGIATPIVSFGTTEYVLTAGGQRVQLAPGKSATIELPLYATAKLNGTPLAAGDSTPLWSLDESTGSWVQEGMGVVVPSAASPSGLAMRAIVTHFSWWNSDLGFEPYGPGPKCVYDTDIGIPGANNTFATATICNMLAEIERGLAPAPRALGAGTHVSSAAANERIAGFALRRTVPIAGGVIIPVPAGVNISLKATALNGTWGGSTVVNGPVGVQAEVLIKMRPLFTIAGPTPEAITLPFDAQRSLAPLQPTALFTFAGVAQRFARVSVRPATGSVLTGRVRLLQGTTVLGSATIPSNGLADIIVQLPTSATYTIEIAGDAAAAFAAGGVGGWHSGRGSCDSVQHPARDQRLHRAARHRDRDDAHHDLSRQSAERGAGRRATPVVQRNRAGGRHQPAGCFGWCARHKGCNTLAAIQSRHKSPPMPDFRARRISGGFVRSVRYSVMSGSKSLAWPLRALRIRPRYCFAWPVVTIGDFRFGMTIA